MPPPAKVFADALVRLIVPVPVTVRLVAVVALKAVPLPETDKVAEPRAKVLVEVPEVLKTPEPPTIVTE